MAALLTVSAGYLYDVFIGGWSLFYMLLIAGGFFSSAIYSVVGPYMAEIWPARLRSSGMGRHALRDCRRGDCVEFLWTSLDPAYPGR